MVLEVLLILVVVAEVEVLDGGDGGGACPMQAWPAMVIYLILRSTFFEKSTLFGPAQLGAVTSCHTPKLILKGVSPGHLDLSAMEAFVNVRETTPSIDQVMTSGCTVIR